MDNKQTSAREWRLRALVRIPMYLSLVTAACSSNPIDSGNVVSGTGGAANTGGSANTGGTPNTGGAANTGGTPNTGGAGSGGATDTGGASSGGALGAGGSSSGGTTNPGGTGGGTKPGTGGSTGNGSGGTGSGGATGTGGSSSAKSSVGCGKTSTITFKPVPNQNANAAPGSGNTLGIGEGGYVTIQSGGGSRDFAMRLPENYDKNKPYWSSFTFHPNGGNAYGAIFVAPLGLGGGWADSGGRDLQFVDDMVKLIEENYCVDTTHIFAQGFSYGGGMSYAIACGRAKVFRGVAIHEGAQLSGCEGGDDPIALWQMAGLEDNTCTIDMAKGLRDRFVKNNGCTAGTEPPRPPKGPPYLNPGGHVCTDYAGCKDGYPVRWCVHQSGHGNAIVDGTNDLYNSCATAPKTCSASCPCSWVPADVWKWMTTL